MRPITKRYITSYTSSPPMVAGFTTAYDRAGNKAFKRALHAEPRSSLYEPIDTSGNVGTSYDSLDRLLQYQRGTLASTGGIGGAGGGSVSTPIALPGSDATRSYTLDGLGNWKQTANGLVGGGGTPTTHTETRAHNYVNQITTDRTAITGGGTTTAAFAYDHGNNADGIQGNGNVINNGVRKYQYDALNRLIQVNSPGETPTPWATYVYDALGRRIRKTVYNGGKPGGLPNISTDYLYRDWQVIEERKGSDDSVIRQMVWGVYVDELIQMVTAVSTGSQPLSAGTYYLLQDLLYRTQALSNSSGSIVEVYDTDAYGNTQVFASFTSSTALAAPSCETIFTGRQYDPETQLYYYRARMYSPAIGRFLQRDPETLEHLTDIYEYVMGKPTILTDSSGTMPDAIAGCLIGASYGVLVDSVKAIFGLDEWNPCKTACKAVLGCLIGGIAAFIATKAGPWGGCFIGLGIGLISQFVPWVCGQLCSAAKMCQPPKPTNLLCAAFGALASASIGCLAKWTKLAGEQLNAWTLKWVDSLAVGLAVGSACKFAFGP